MEKRFAVSLVLALTVVLTAACGGNNAGNNNAGTAANSGSNNAAATNDAGTTDAGTATNAPSDLSGTIKVLTQRTDYVNDGTFDRYAAKFKGKYPNAKIEFEGLTNYATDIQVRLTTGEAGDVLMIPAGLATSEYGKYFEPLPDEWFNNVYFADNTLFDGKRYGLSTGVNTQGIVYNKKAFAAAGIDKVPTTLDELYADAEKLKAAKITPLYMNYGAQWPMGNWGDGSAWYVNGDPQFATKQVSEDAPFQLDNAWGTLATIGRTFVEKGYVEKDLYTNNWEMSKGEVASGKAAMYFLGNWVIPQIIGAGAASEDIGFFPLPYDNSGKYNAPLGSDYFVAVSKDSKNKDLAKAWVEFFVKESGYVEDSGFMPIDKSAQSSIPQLAEFQALNPTLIESEATDPKYNEIANKAQIGIGTGDYVQEYIVADDLKAAFDKLNKKWKDAKTALGY
ncbi:sugar ABC transporter substrate-binding protein [Paenibacillus glycanilyticus]|uniref:Sugar ABC transporter substrate-binding protein n=1 Tax=Paenibacillus glycanilyticus TaxID=126569 RepID=A0ABQ6NDY6_9BACL|nr:extracellular solute-binding protein [Paenibacillus glycanilyticus]GMK43167.1 sugar ABC transporter substrate-binding protein [Paenibacillus glycanilyticus]